MTDLEVANELNRTIPDSTYRVLDSNELIPWAATGADTAPSIATGWPRKSRIEAASTESAPYTEIGKPASALAWSALMLVTKETATLDLNRPDRVAMLDGLVAVDVLSSTEKASLLALAQLDPYGNARTTTRAGQIGLGGKVLEGHVTKARAV